MIETNDIRVGTAFEMDGELLTIVTVEHIKLARAGAVIKAKLRNVRDGAIFEQSFRGLNPKPPCRRAAAGRSAER